VPSAIAGIASGKGAGVGVPLSEPWAVAPSTQRCDKCMLNRQLRVAVWSRASDKAASGWRETSKSVPRPPSRRNVVIFSVSVMHIGVFARNGEWFWRAAQLEIIPSDFGNDAYQHVELVASTEATVGMAAWTERRTRQRNRAPSGSKAATSDTFDSSRLLCRPTPGYATASQQSRAPPGTPRNAREKLKLYGRPACWTPPGSSISLAVVRRSVQDRQCQRRSGRSNQIPTVLVSVIAEVRSEYFDCAALPKPNSPFARKKTAVCAKPRYAEIHDARLEGGRGTDFDVSRSRSLLYLTLSTYRHSKLRFNMPFIASLC